jgi:molybdate transport system permease protein
VRGTRPGFAAVALVALTVALAFLVIPIVAVFTNTGPGELVGALGEHGAREALWLSLKTSLAALAVIVAVGTPAAYVLATHEFRGGPLVLTLIELPLVMPPAAAGIALLAAFGPNGILGGAISDAGIELVFETVGVIVALIFVAAPFYLRAGVAAFAALDVSSLEASRTLGAGPGRTFLRVAIPEARAGLAAGLALTWARALGEFGATLMFAGSFPGITRTASLEIFATFNTPNGFTSALALSGVLVAVSAALLLTVKLVTGERALEGRGI